MAPYGKILQSKTKIGKISHMKIYSDAYFGQVKLSKY